MADNPTNDVQAQLHHVEHHQAHVASAFFVSPFEDALDNMPGALVYTDEELAIVVCNQRFREMYPVPAELLQPGRPYTDFLRHQIAGDLLPSATEIIAQLGPRYALRKVFVIARLPDS